MLWCDTQAVSTTPTVDSAQTSDDPTEQISTYRPRSLSPSSAGTFRNCNRRWKFHYIDNLPDPPSEPALVGTFVHKVLEDLLELPAAERTLTQAQKICGNNWGTTEESADFKSLEYNEEQEKDFKWKAWNFIEGYFKMFDPGQIEVVQREQQLDSAVGEVPFRGIVDLLERDEAGLRVTDYKTGKPPRAPYVDDSLAQIWLYAAALENSGETIASVQLAYLGNGKDRQGKTISRPMDKRAMGKAVDQHNKTWKDIHTAIDSGDFPPLTGPLCGWCPYREHCPEGQAEYERRYGPEV